MDSELLEEVRRIRKEVQVGGWLLFVCVLLLAVMNCRSCAGS